MATDLQPSTSMWGALLPAMEASGVTDVLVNAPDQVWIDRGNGLEKTGIRFSDAAQVRELAIRLASLGGRRLDDAEPLVDARLPDGSRLHAVLPPLARECTYVSIRRIAAQGLTLQALLKSGWCSAAQARFLAQAVSNRQSMVISGATGAGKTTVLSALLGLVPPGERVAVIEEAGEIASAHPHVVYLSERRANVEGAGAVGLSVLLRNALRMRPDRLVLGEARGAEIREVLLALNTGHQGGFTTVHANALEDVPARLLALGLLTGWTEAVVATFAAAAFPLVAHVERREGKRVLAGVGHLRAGNAGLSVEPVEFA